MVKVAVINPGSKVVEVSSVEPTLENFKPLVGGWLEMLYLAGDLRAYINEEGKGLGLPRNSVGDTYVRASLARIGHTLLPGDYIVGPVVLLGAPDDEGIETDVPDDVLAELREAGLEVREA